MPYNYHKPVLEILNQLENTSSRNEKKEILQKYKDHPVLRLTLDAALNPFYQYGIKQIPNYRVSKVEQSTLANAIHRLNVLTERKKTGHAAQEWLSQQLEGLEDIDAEVYERIIKKDLRVGVSAKTVNDVFPGMIPEFPNMLCDEFNEKNLERIDFPAFIQEKLDGMRVNFIFQNGKLSLRTRNGKTVDLVEQFEDGMKKMFPNEDVVLDGELLVLNEHGKPMTRKKGNGILNKATKGTIKDEEKVRVVAYIWDAIPYQNFRNAETLNVPYYRRWQMVQKMIKNLGSDKYNLPATQEVESMYEARKFFLNIVNKGGEGAVLKSRHNQWTNTRAKDCLKMKVVNEADLEIVDVIEGEGKYEGRLGSFLLQSKDGGLEVNVGSGFTDENRDNFFTKSMIGKIATVKYNEIIERDDNEKKSLFLPIFVEVRKDKNEANDLSELK